MSCPLVNQNPLCVFWQETDSPETTALKIMTLILLLWRSCGGFIQKISGWWHSVSSNHVSRWLVDDVTYSSLCEGWTMRKRVFIFRVKHECAFPERSCCCARCWTERLCGQNNGNPFAPLSYRETTSSNKEAKSVDSASPTTSPRMANYWDDWEKRALWKR